MTKRIRQVDSYYQPDGFQGVALLYGTSEEESSLQLVVGPRRKVLIEHVNLKDVKFIAYDNGVITAVNEIEPEAGIVDLKKIMASFGYSAVDLPGNEYQARRREDRVQDSLYDEYPGGMIVEYQGYFDNGWTLERALNLRIDYKPGNFQVGKAAANEVTIMFDSQGQEAEYHIVKDTVLQEKRVFGIAEFAEFFEALTKGQFFTVVWNRGDCKFEEHYDKSVGIFLQYGTDKVTYRTNCLKDDNRSNYITLFYALMQAESMKEADKSIAKALLLGIDLMKAEAD